MESRAYGSPVNQSGFTRPPVSDTYISPHSLIDTSDTNTNHGSSTLERHRGPEPSHDPYYNHQVAASSTATPFQVPYPNYGSGLPTFGQSDPSRSPVSSWGLETTPSLPKNHGPSNTYAASSSIASGSPEAALKKGPPGTYGHITCDQCDMRFTAPQNLDRHQKKSCVKRKPEDPSSTPNKVTKTKSTSTLLKSKKNINAVLADEARPTTPREQDQDLPCNQNLDVKSTTSTIASSSAAGNAALIATPSTPDSRPHQTAPIQGYIPKGPDTTGDHTIFTCDLCPDSFDRRDLLQTHKYDVHGLVEFPYMPESRQIAVPPYLQGVTSEKGPKPSRAALRIYQHGALSSSPCKPCEVKHYECIVSFQLSSKCSYCTYRAKSTYCGAAGVKCA